jgi:hypothetical protein
VDLIACAFRFLRQPSRPKPPMPVANSGAQERRSAAEKASALVEDAWQSIPELVVTITESRHSLHGVIPLTDIGTAMAILQSNCPKAAHSR